MPVVNIKEAAELAGVARSTLYRKRDQGKISFTKLPDGQPGIDTAELYRVYPQQMQHDLSDTTNATDATREDSRKIAELQLELRLIREQLVASNEREVWLRNQVDNLTGALKLLEHKPADPEPEPVPPSRRSWLSRFFRRAA